LTMLDLPLCYVSIQIDSQKSFLSRHTFHLPKIQSLCV